MGQDIHRAGHNPPPDDYITFLRNTAFARNTINAMRQRVLLSWMGNADDTDPVNALNNLLHEEQHDASTQVLEEQDANFEAPPAGERTNNNQHQAPHNVRAPPHGLAAPGGALRAAQQQFEHHGGKYIHFLCFSCMQSTLIAY